MAGKITPEKSAALKNLLRDSLKDQGNDRLANVVNNAVNWEHAISNLAVMGNSSELNSLVGDLTGFIAKQTIKAHNLDKIVGDCFVEGEEINSGEGLNYVETVLNGVGTNAPVNYQTSTATTGEIALGTSFSNSNQIQVLYKALPLLNGQQLFTGSDNGTATAMQMTPILTFNKTIPVTWAQFSTLSPIEVDRLLSAYYDDIENAVKIFKYSLGNFLFGYVGSQYLVANNISLNNNNGWTTAVTEKNFYSWANGWFIPFLQGIQRLSNQYNGGDSSAAAGNWNTSTLAAFPWVVANSSVTYSVINQPKPEDLRIYMNPQVMATFLSLQNLPNFQTMNIERDGQTITKICGIEVIVVGTNIVNTTQTAQGTTITPSMPGSYVLPNTQIMIADKDYLTWSKLYDNTYTSDVWGNAMIKTVRRQIAYLPIVKPWKTGVILTFSNPLNFVAKMPVLTTAD